LASCVEGFNFNGATKGKVRFWWGAIWFGQHWWHVLMLAIMAITIVSSRSAISDFFSLHQP
jgi:hypothetical protein